MLIFKFSGALRRFFSEVSMNVETPAQGLRLLFAQNSELKKYFMRNRVNILINHTELNNDNAVWNMERKLCHGSTVSFVPVVAGGGLETGTIIAIVSLVVAAASVAYSIYMARNMKNKNSAESADTIENNSFTNAENRVGQGRPVPILIGEMVVGSNVISLGINTENPADWDEIID
ncbi:tail assembly protein [Kosakonia sacchari]|uniref:tail assembly protein n=1 Tax=Kosakonia sacchari TaxID=1158459 RepID=UPI001585600D|nr:tail assembly protein [Kosakonia sacchari]NUL36647.1 tail assembly protein [Kosakonia sacchari]